MQTSRSSYSIFLLALLLVACGGEQTPASADSAARPDDTASPSAAEEAQTQESVGSVRFTVGGAEKSFDHVPGTSASYSSLGSSLWAYPETGSTESLSIIFMSIDLKKLDYPTELPLPKDLSKPMDPMAAMASVGLSYIDADGEEWAGPGKLNIDSFSKDGVVRGTFDDVTLPHTDKELPDLTLSDGSFSVRITAPW